MLAPVAYLPPSHTEQALPPATSEYLPTAQAVHSLLEIPEYRPASHGAQSAKPLWGYLPTEQRLHSEPLASAMVEVERPGSHGTQDESDVPFPGLGNNTQQRTHKNLDLHSRSREYPEVADPGGRAIFTSLAATSAWPGGRQ